MNVAERLIVALDDVALGPALATARRLRGLIRIVKIGSALFTASGPEAIRRVRSLGFEVMLDLKFFDIPSTVEASCRAAVRHGISKLTVHSRGGPAMLEAAVRGVREEARRRRRTPPDVLGVTVLTSAGDKHAGSVTAEVVRLAQQARAAGCDGVVASAQEARALRRRFGARWQIVCPGIRPAGAAGTLARKARDDQRRVCTPRDALEQGATTLVVGRPITAARDPRAAAQEILNEMEWCAC